VPPSSPFALLPRVDRVVAHDALSEARARLGAALVTRLARETIDAARRDLRAEDGGVCPTEDQVAAATACAAAAWLGLRARRVVNATGILLHTNLGRAPLAPAAVAALADTAGAYVSLELDLATGKRGRRGAFAERALAEMSGAQDALVVNNGAAAILLVASACFGGRDVIVSRGEVVEIGGGFRISEIIARSGARLVEVGSTNRTHASDYARALESCTAPAAILRVHQANFRQVGFVGRPSITELSDLARASGALLVDDQGSGARGDLADLGLAGEPLARAALDAGADAVTFSTDKLLGGPQGGVIVGRTSLVSLARRDPLARALRLGRLALVALEATLEGWLSRGESAIPVLSRARLGEAVQRSRALRWRTELEAAGIDCEIVATRGEMGGGSQPGEGIASAALRLASRAPHDLAARLRACDPAVLVRIEDGAILVDALAIAEAEERELVVALLAVLVGDRVG